MVAISASITAVMMSSCLSKSEQSRAFAANPTLSVRIELDNHYTIKVYASGNSVSGTVYVTTREDSRIDYVQILLIGTTRSCVDGLQKSHTTQHVFLKVAMPNRESAYLVPRIFQAGRTYTFPFNFVIPHQLAINACGHPVTSDHIHDVHLRLPPTLGFWAKDDLAPQMAQVKYNIKARIYRTSELGGKPVKLFESSELLRVLPSAPEEPPLSIDAKTDVLYRMSHSKSVRKNMFSSIQGKVTAKASQPCAIFVTPDAQASATSTTAYVDLDFVPKLAEARPPRVVSVSAKVAAHTFYADGPISEFPNLGNWKQDGAGNIRSSYKTSVSLATVSFTGAPWTTHIGRYARRDSGYSSDSPPAAGPAAGSDDSDHEAQHSPARSTRLPLLHSGQRRQSGSGSKSESLVTYTTRLQVPLALPHQKKTFVPTFHSCIASRVYILQLSVVLDGSSGCESGKGAATSGTTLTLNLPLQISVGPAAGQGQGVTYGGLPGYDAAMRSAEEEREAAEADEHLRPRVMQTPVEELLGTSVLPGYDD